MKKSITLVLFGLLLVSCGISPEEQAKLDKKEIREAKKEIDLLVSAVKDEYYDDDNLDLHNTYHARRIAKFETSEHDEVAKYALSQKDSITSFINYWQSMIFEDLFEFAEKQGWNKLSDSDFKSLEKQIIVKSDEFSTNVIYRSPTSPKYINMNGFFIYYVKSDESSKDASLVLKAQYYDDDWLFVKDAKVSIDGEVYFTNLKDWGNDHSGGKIYEWSSKTSPSYSLIVKILESKSSKVRYYGNQYYDDRTITNTQKIALKQVLKAYYGLYVKGKVNYELHESV